MAIRKATHDDLAWIMSLCELDRANKNSLHPIDYKEPAAYCRSRRQELERILADLDSLCLIRDHYSQPQAFLIARLVNAPPVYSPGGPVCFVEEFESVRHDDLPTFGAQLLDECRRVARQRGAVLQRVISSAGDLAREQFLLGAGFTLASEWYVGATDRVRQPEPVRGTIRRAGPGDLPLIFSLSEKKRRQYEEYQPVFWRAATITIEAVAPFLMSQLQDDDSTALIHETRRGLDGFLIASRGTIDDFTVTPDKTWPTVGAALLAEASRQAAEKGVERLTVICGHLDQYKRSMIADLGFELTTNWYIRNF